MDKRYKINEKIRAPEVRVIVDDGDNLGVLKTNDALAEARKRGLDLVLIAEQSNPPVAKILDFTKFLYESNKKAQAAKAKSRKSELKELRFGPLIGDGDLNQRVERAKEWLKEGNRVRFIVRMKGRQNLRPELGFQKLEKVATELDAVARKEDAPKHQGKDISVVFVTK